MKTVPRTHLAKNYSISLLIKGGWQLAGGHGTVDRPSAIKDMELFVENGVTTFDFADIYTGVEELVGQFLKGMTARYGTGYREKLQLHTKCVPDLDKLNSLTKQDVEKAIDRSLTRLGVEQIDLVQFHWWDFKVKKYLEIAEYLKEIQEKGKIRFLGVTNFDVDHLKELADAGISIVSNQVQYSVIDRRPENKMVEFCQENNINLLCYGTVAGGFLSEKYLDAVAPIGELENRSLVKYSLIIEEYGGWDVFQKLLKVLDSVAKKHNVSIANVGCKYILDKQKVAGIIVGARNSDHMVGNLKMFNLILDSNDCEEINSAMDNLNAVSDDIYSFERITNGQHVKIMKQHLNSKS